MSDATVQIKTARLTYVGAGHFLGESQSGHAVATSFDSPSLAASPMELILVALGGCTGADIVSILEKKRQKVTGYEIEVKAERRAEHPRIYTSIEVIHKLKGRSLEARAVEHAISLSHEKYCSVSAMLGASAKITMTFELIEDEA